MNDDETRSDLEEDLVLPKRSPLIDDDAVVDGDVEVEDDVMDSGEEDENEDEEDDA